jgi:glycine/D-amino acid oxidase-like deaminating enzyme
MRVVVIGAGIAGLATAWRLAAHGVSQVTLLERESLPFSHSSARNAAIFRPLETSQAVVELVASSDQLLSELSADPLIQRTGLLLTAEHRRSLEPLVATAQTSGVPHDVMTSDELFRVYPELRGGRSTSAVWLPRGGVMDIHRVCETLRTSARKWGVEIRLNTEASSVGNDGASVSGVSLTSGEVIPGDCVVIAAGAWSEALGANAGAPLTLTPHRRHLALMLPTTSAKLPNDRPVAWDTETGIYFRPESTGVLACPGDHEPTQAGVPIVNPETLERLAVELPRLCPLLGSYGLVRPWACLRTMATNRAMAIGPDPRVRGLFWFAGLGGQGMSAGLGGAEVLARLIVGKPIPEWVADFAVERHLDPKPSPFEWGAP